MKKLTVKSCIEYIETKLGAKFVTVETITDMENVVKISLMEISEYITLNHHVTIPYMQRIDLSKYDVRSITRVMRAANVESITTTGASTDAFQLAVGMIQGVPYDMSRYAQLMEVRKVKNTISTDLDWIWEDPYLYVTQNPMQCAMITIEFTPNINKVSDIDEDYWKAKFLKLCLANAKIQLGRVRGKYKLNNALYDNDASILLDEGNREHDELMKFLENNSDIILPVGS